MKKNMTIGIIVAMEEELTPIFKHNFTSQKDETVNNRLVHHRTLETDKVSIDLIATQCGVGKVKAAAATQFLIQQYSPEFIINFGLGGCLKEGLKVGDICIATHSVQADFDLSVFGRKPVFREHDNDLIDKVENVLQEKNIPHYKGIVATGDQFLSDKEKKQLYHNNLNAMLFEMEVAAIREICEITNVPFLSIKMVSDNADETSNEDFDNNLDHYSDRLSDVVWLLLNEM